MKTTITETVNRYVSKCDFCDTITNLLCCICEKDVCKFHSSVWFEDFSEDYPRRICKECNTKTEKCQEELVLLREKYEKDEETILTKMRECVKVK